MLKFARSAYSLRAVLKETLIESGLKPDDYDLNKMAVNFSDYLNEDLGQMICDKAKHYIDDDFISDFERKYE
ncbi:MAG: hypothetical protein LBH29_07215 [Elusimicrobiota bacterium]|jgi:hypothetical protein|nr:hypothetical protein [Elusimicrobiota bacterium]